MPPRPFEWDPPIRAKLDALMREYGRGAALFDPGRPPVATFDWDDTSIGGDIGVAVVQRLDERDGGRRLREYERRRSADGRPACYVWLASQIAGMSDAEVRTLTNDTIDTFLRDGRLVIREAVRDLMHAMRERGFEVWVVSASVEPVVRVFAERYGVAADRVIGVRLAMDESGRYRAVLAGPLTWRRGKVEAIERFIGRAPTFAIGDTDTDIEMLESARHALLIDRGNPDALEAARRGGFWVQPLRT